jgi:poly(hydroxyalkanoate) depolymerase family esterase
MTPNFRAAMHKALQLTRQYRLTEATAAIRAALAGGRQSEADAASPPPPPTRPKRPLAAVVETLWRNKLPDLGPDGVKAKRPRPEPVIPDGAAFLARSFLGNAGRRDYRLYVPSRPAANRRALIVMLHGCKQDPVDFAVGTRMNALAETHGFLVAYPGQARAANPAVCWNWFNPRDQRQGMGEPAIIAGLTREIIAEFAIDPARVFIAGLSAGGAMAAVMGATDPDLYAAIGVHSGLPYGAANDVVSAFAAMRGEAPLPSEPAKLPCIIFHGEADPTVHPSNATRIAGTTDGLREVESGTAKGRAYTRTIARAPLGQIIGEHWLIHGAVHAWSGGDGEGSYTDPKGPDASREMVRFFLERARR